MAKIWAVPTTDGHIADINRPLYFDPMDGWRIGVLFACKFELPSTRMKCFGYCWHVVFNPGQGLRCDIVAPNLHVPIDLAQRSLISGQDQQSIIDVREQGLA